LTLCDALDLAGDRGDTRARDPEGEALDEELHLWAQPMPAVITATPPHQTGQTVLAVASNPALGRSERDAVLAREHGQRHLALKVRREHPESLEGERTRLLRKVRQGG
jgi:hypothetical protein